MELDRWALAFTILPWPESRKAQLWASLQAGLVPKLEPEAERAFQSLDPTLLREQAARKGARLWLPSDTDAAPLLSELPYPVALWVRGSLPPRGIAVAMVGSREPSPLGRDRARSWGRELTQAGVAVLSGLARGIDGAAHLGALEAGATWGVMGSGLDHPYPPEHNSLMARMVAAGGGVLTPFPPDAKPMKWHFPRRNWLLAAWTQGVVVVEAKLRSGSLVTARLALDLGRELWACPGAPENPLAEGPNALLREGAAQVCRTTADILEDLQSLPLWDIRP